MSGRDLLYKPQVVIYPDESTETGKVKGDKADKSAKPGVKAPKGRELGQVGKDALNTAQEAGKAQQAGKPQAFKAAYFNKDTSGVRDANLGASQAKALRGSNEATDLKKIVLPPSVYGITNPDPAQLRGAADLMGLDGSFDPSMESFLSRQGAWAQSKGMTVEKLKERMEQLEAMVELRKAALGRMADGRSDQPVTSVTVLQAATTAGGAVTAPEDIAAAGTDLVKKTSGQAEGLHYRVAKMFGIKRPQP